MSNHPRKIFIFDIDGVLVDPLGYRHAVLSTLKWLFPQPAVDSLLPTFSDQGVFESLQITSEWDMVAISSILIAGEIIGANPLLNPPKELHDWRHLEIPINPQRIKYQQLLPRIVNKLDPDAINPSEAFYKYSTNAQGRSSLSPVSRLPSGLLEILLTTRNITISPSSSLFQNYSLGSQEFEACYQIPAYITSEPYLLTYDRPLISPETSSRLKKLQIGQSVSYAAMTARPSRFPCKAKNTPTQFPPEAEMALELVNLPDMPVIGLGTLAFAKTAKWKLHTAIIKPAPFHGLAAILAACGLPEIDAAQAAINLIQREPTNITSQVPNELDIFTFEDTTGGIQSIDQAVKILHRYGFRMNVQNFGISDQPEKIKSLVEIGAKVFPNTEAALKFAIET